MKSERTDLLDHWMPAWHQNTVVPLPEVSDLRIGEA